MNTPFDIKISIDSGVPADQATTGSSLNAICKIQAKDSFRVKAIRGSLVLQTKGRLVEQKKVIDNFQIMIEPQTLMSGNIYEFPFTFTKKSPTETYKGKNVSFLYSLQLSIDLHEEDYDKLKRGVFKKVKSLFTGDKSVKHIAYLELNSNEENYFLQDFQQKMKPQLAARAMYIPVILMTALFGAIGYFGIPAFTQSSFEPNFVLVLFISLALAGMIQAFFSHVLILSFAGHMEMFLDQQNKDFLSCKITHLAKAGLSHAPTLYYEVVEKVIDRRGTSTSTSRESIFQSQKQILKTREPDHSYTFAFPDQKNIPSLQQGDASIFWDMVVETKTQLGFQIHYRARFEVVKGKY